MENACTLGSAMDGCAVFHGSENVQCIFLFQHWNDHSSDRNSAKDFENISRKEVLQIYFHESHLLD